MVFLALDVPVAFSIGIATVLAIFSTGELPALLLVAQRMATGIDSFALLAIPFFILSGLLMGQGGIARRLIDFADVLVGRFRGGLSHVNVMACMLFGSISGSAAAAVSSVGGFMIPAMNRRGYHRDFNASVTTTAATTGLLIPPSNVMIIYSMATGGQVSIAAIFVAGIAPGILVGLGLMGVCAFLSVARSYGRGDAVDAKQALIRFGRAVPALFLVVIVLGGILSGAFTATEASAVAVVYALILSVAVYREVKIRDLPEILLRCCVLTSVVLLMVGTSMAMSWILSYENIPQELSAGLIGMTENRLVILLLINVVLLLVGTFMDMTPAILVFTPIFLPVARSLGMDPLHFGVMMILNLCIGLCTPPVGTCLFLGCGIAETTMTRMIRHLIPFFLAMVVVLLITTYVPALSLTLPALFGF